MIRKTERTTITFRKMRITFRQTNLVQDNNKLTIRILHLILIDFIQIFCSIHENNSFK